MDDRAKLDEMIAELTIARRDQVQAREDYKAAQRRGEEARVRAQGVEKAIVAHIDVMTNAGDDDRSS